MSSTHTKKIVFSLLSVMFLLMGLVIYYHYQHQAQPIMLNQEKALLFTAGRDLKPFSIQTGAEQKFSERNLAQHWTLVSFGFTHCSSICPATLGMLSKAYPALHKSYPNLQVLFVSVDPERDSPEEVNTYAKRFHPDFVGATAKLTEVRKLQGQFGVASMRDENSLNQDYQIIHTPSIMLVNPKGQWVAMFKNDVRPNEFIQLFEQSVNR